MENQLGGQTNSSKSLMTSDYQSRRLHRRSFSGHHQTVHARLSNLAINQPHSVQVNILSYKASLSLAIHSLKLPQVKNIKIEAHTSTNKCSTSELVERVAASQTCPITSKVTENRYLSSCAAINYQNNKCKPGKNL